MNACDALEACTGSSVACPADLPIDCDDGNACTADSCDEITGCFNDPIPGCGVSAVPAMSNGGLAMLALIFMATALVVMLRKGERAV